MSTDRPRRRSLPVGLLAAALGASGVVGAPPATAAPAKAPNKVTSKATSKAVAATPPGEQEAEGPPPPESSPLADLKRTNAQLKKLLGNRKPSWSPEAQARNAELRKVVSDLLDFDELARRALGRHWQGLDAKQQIEFVKTLRELAERNYVRQFYGQPDYDLRLEKEEKGEREAVVTGTLHASSKGKKVTMALEYRLLYKSKRWVVYDVITDDLSLLENYRAEFNKVIVKEGFDALLGRMQRKLDEKPND
jgi:phospholipid transport system substrate-binding protein